MAGYIGTQAVSVNTTSATISDDLSVGDDALITGTLTTTAATVFNGGFASNADSTMGTDKKLIFRDSAIHISSTADGDMSIAADDEIDITSTLIDINGAVDMSSTLAVAGISTFTGDVNITKTGAGDDTTLKVATSANTGDNDATVIVGNGGTGDSMIRFDYEGTNTDRARIGVIASDQILRFYTGGDNERFKLTSAGAFVTGALDVSTNAVIGGALEIRNGGTQQVIIGNSGSYAGSEIGELLFKESNTELARVKWNPSGNTFQLINKIAGPMTFATSDTERIRIASNGDFHWRKTAQAINTGGVSFINSASYVEMTRDQGTALYVNRTTNDGAVVEFARQGTTVGSISVNGSATAYNTSSDYRLKTDAQPMTGASARVQALNPVNFEWIADGSRVDGFLAHEAQAVVPECVTGSKDAMKDEEYQVSATTGDIYTPATDEADEVIHSADAEQPETLADGQQWRETAPAVMRTRSVPDMQGIDQSKLVPLLVASLQEALARITVLENA